MKTTKFLGAFAAISIMCNVVPKPPLRSAVISSATSVQQSIVRDDILNKIEDFLNNITTLEADFVQIDWNGARSVGHFFLKRPYHMKMDYCDPPVHLIVAHGGKTNKLIHYDRELHEKDEFPLHSSPIAFFLEKKIDLRRELQKNLQLQNIQDGEDRISIKFSTKNKEGAITLVFSKNPFVLRKWEIQENHTKCTHILLFNWKYGEPIDDAVFESLSPTKITPLIGKITPVKTVNSTKKPIARKK